MILSLLLVLVPISLLCAPLAFADTPIDAGSAAASATASTASAPAAVPSLPDPTAHPAEAATSAWGLVHQYGWLWGVMIVLFGIGTAIVKLNDERHWLSKDHTLPIVVGVLGVLGAALQAKFGGGSWAGVLATAFGALMLLLQKPAPGKQAPSTATAS